MSRDNDQTYARQAADAVDNVADGIRSAANNAGESVRNAAHTVRDAAGRAVNSVEETYEDAGRYARDSMRRGQARFLACENGFESQVRQNPWASLLIAAALGGIIVTWFRRR